MPTVFSVALVVHIVCGSLALASFPVSALVRKGSPLHRRAGWVFVLAIGAGTLSSLVLSGIRLSDDRPENDAGALFLAYIAILTGNLAWFGVRALRGRLRQRRATDLVLPSLLALGAVTLGGFGLHLGKPLYAAFAALGLALSAQLLAAWKRPPSTRLESLLLHVGAIGGACTATVTALVVVNAGNLGLGQGSLWAWLTPPALGFVLVRGARLRLRRPASAPMNVEKSPA
jgi:uncharacterized membrane protein